MFNLMTQARTRFISRNRMGSRHVSRRGLLSMQRAKAPCLPAEWDFAKLTND